MRSSLEIHDLGSGENRLLNATDRLIEAPNWSPDGRFLVFNGDQFGASIRRSVA